MLGVFLYSENSGILIGSKKKQKSWKTNFPNFFRRQNLHSLTFYVRSSGEIPSFQLALESNVEILHVSAGLYQRQKIADEHTAASQ